MPEPAARSAPCCAALVLLLASVSCATERAVTVRAGLAGCTGVGPQTCLRVSEEGGPDQLAYGAIDGFAFAWCVERDLVVSREAVPNAPADASAVRTRLVHERAARPSPVGTVLSLVVDKQLLRETGGADERTWTLPGVAPCQGVACEKLEGALAGGSDRVALDVVCGADGPALASARAVDDGP